MKFVRVLFVLIILISITDRISAQVITTVAGNGSWGYSGDGGPAISAQLSNPTGVFGDISGNIYISDYDNHCVRLVNSSGTITTIAGGNGYGSSGDGGSATAATFTGLEGNVAVDASGNIFIADKDSNRVRKVNALTDIITGYAGSPGYPGAFGGYSGDGGQAINAELNKPVAITFDNAGNMYVADRWNYVVRKITPLGIISTVAGNNTPGYSGDGGPAIQAQIQDPGSISVDNSGNIYIGDFTNSRIRKVDGSGIISTFAGNGSAGYNGDGGPATQAQIGDEHGGISADNLGNVYIADYSNNVIRKVSSGGTISTIAGTGSGGYTGDGGNASDAEFNGCISVFADDNETLYVVDKGNHVLRKIELARFCDTMSVRFYHDDNGNCSYDQGTDVKTFLPVLVQVDSNNTTIDTISSTAGFNYLAYGNDGDVYQFKILELPGSIFPACPATGIITDTFQTGVNAIMYMGLDCSITSGFDFGLDLSLLTAANRSDADLLISNAHCLPQNGVVTMTFSPKYQFHSANITPALQSGNTATWNINGLSAFTSQPTHLHVRLNHNGIILTPGDTVHTKFEITPTVGDINPNDNIIIRHDTVTGPYDPNAVYVSPSGCVVPGTRLQYTVTFENLGNALAENIYIMDTLSAGFEMQSIKLLAASHLMNVTKVSNGGYNILKFEFPNINLPDSSSPDRHGMVMYTIDMVDNFPIGSSVTNKAGIFFDYMPAVLTNVASTTACWPANVIEVVLAEDKILIYPNPATEELTIKTEKQFTSYTVTNSIGQLMMQQDMNGKESKVNIKSLSTGMYYINLKGEQGSEVRKFVKL